MKVLVTGATGSVGGHLIKKLREKDIDIRAISRHPEQYNMEQGVEVYSGDLSDGASLEASLKDVDCLFLLLNYDVDPSIIERAEKAGVKKVVALSDGTVYPVEEELCSSSLEWVMLCPMEFMKNALVYWQDSIRYDNVARAPFPEAKTARIHEKDIAAVAVVTILEDGHHRQRYYMTGPETLTVKGMVDTIAKVMDKDIEFIELSEKEARERYKMLGFNKDLIDFAIETSKNPKEYYYIPNTTVFDLTGQKASTFEEWVEDHKEDFQ